MKVWRPKDFHKQNFFCCIQEKPLFLKFHGEVVLLLYYYGLFNREVVVWRISDIPNSELCVNTLLDLSSKYDLNKCIIPSDAGASYVNNS